MSVLAHFFESYGFSTVLVGFVKEHIEAIQPPRALWLDFPMGRPLGKPNDPEYQKKIIRSAFDLFNERSGPVLKDFPDIIPVKDGRMGYALPVELVLKKNEIENLNEEINKLRTISEEKLLFSSIINEAKLIYPDLNSFEIYESIRTDFQEIDTVLVVSVLWSEMVDDNTKLQLNQSIKNWIGLKFKSKNIEIEEKN